MRYRCIFALILGGLAAGIASPQTLPSDLVTYLNLSGTQVQAINQLDNAFTAYTNKQSNAWYSLQSQAQTELAKDSPDASAVGNDYAQMEMISRDYSTQLAQVQSNVAAVLTPGQVTLVSALLSAERLRTLLSEASCISMEPQQPYFALEASSTSASSYNNVPLALLIVIPYTPPTCTPVPLPTGLVSYFTLSDAQISTIENAIQANQDYVNRQSVTIKELQFQIQDLTAAQTIDTLTLGADYVQIAQIQRDENTQAGQLMTTVRSVLAGQQQPLLQALDNAANMSQTASEAVYDNILVLPPDLSTPCAYPSPPFGAAGCIVERQGNFSGTSVPSLSRYTRHGTK
jgi:hypothetical protein